MKNALQFCREKMNEYYGSEIDMQTIMFLESYGYSVHGDCIAILEHIINDERYNMYKFVWAIPDFKYINDDFNNRYGERIEFVVNNSIDFIKRLSTSGIIFSSALLPTYYIKNDKQIVVGVFPEYLYDDSDTVTNARARLQIALGKCDLVYMESTKQCDMVSKKFYGEIPFEVLSGIPLRHGLNPLTDEPIVIALTGEYIGNNYAGLEKAFKMFKLEAINQNETFLMILNHDKWEAYQEENDARISGHIFSDNEPLCRYLKNARVLITDRLTHLQEAAKLGIPCIFLCRKIIMFYRSEIDTENIRLANSVEEAIDCLSEVLTIGQKEQIELNNDGINTLLSETISMVDSKQSSSSRGDTLFILSSALSHDVWNAFSLLKKEIRPEVLFREIGKGKLWKSRGVLAADIPMYSAFGNVITVERKASNAKVIYEMMEEGALSSYMADTQRKHLADAQRLYGIEYTSELPDDDFEDTEEDMSIQEEVQEEELVTTTNESDPNTATENEDEISDELQTSDILSWEIRDFELEWKRVLGNREYKKIYFVGNGMAYWDGMLAYAPAEEFEIISKADFIKYILDNNANSILNNNWSLENRIVEFEGEQYFDFGMDAFDKIMVKVKKLSANTILVNLSTKKDIERFRILMELYSDGVFFIHDKNELLDGDEDFLGLENVYWLPIKKLPIYLFYAASSIALFRDSTINTIASILEKDTIVVEGRHFYRDALSKNIKLLLINDETEMI